MIIKFSIDKIVTRLDYNNNPFVVPDPANKERSKSIDKFKLTLYHIDKDFLKFFNSRVWHIDFKDRKIFMRHSSTPCRINQDRFSILIDSTHTNVSVFTDKEVLFYLNNKKTTYEFDTNIKDFKELFIKAMYILVENYKKLPNYLKNEYISKKPYT